MVRWLFSHIVLVNHNAELTAKCFVSVNQEVSNHDLECGI